MPMSEPSGSNNGTPSPLKSVPDYLAHLQAHIQPLTRTAAQLPGPSDLSFHRSLDRSLLKDLDLAKDDIVSTLNSLLGSITSTSQSAKGKEIAIEAWDMKAEDLIDGKKFSRKLGDIVDTLLEKADTKLDEHQGRSKPSDAFKSRAEKERINEKNGIIPPIGPLPNYILNANIQPLPQHKFSKKPDNSRERLWKHDLIEKPHAKVSLSWKAPSPGPDEPIPVVGTRQGMYCAEGDPRENPYFYEINNFIPPDDAVNISLQVEDLIAPPPLQKDDPSSGPIPFLWVDDEISFQALYDHLEEDRVKEIAIDVEHHNYRSFQGLVCLVQISTRWQDFIIDAISPEIRKISSRLNQVFADDTKVKILHGAEHDILWLQRDMELYIVGLFDTYHATNVLNFPQHSLAFLLSRYIEFEADKRYQLADWRIRPLNKEMMFYARSDTHSLIYIYDCMRFEIAKKDGVDGIKKVFELSKRTASKTYAKEEWDSSGEGREGWKSLWKRLGGIESVGVDERWQNGGVEGLHKIERIFRALHDWRDKVARKEDESPRYILPTNNLLNLSSRVPVTQEAVLPCVGPAFKKRASDVAQLIAHEVKEYEDLQKKKGEIERAGLRSMQDGSQVEEEVGEVLTRDAPKKLWPVDESVPIASGSSSIASLLFAPAIEGGKSSTETSSKTPSLFAPLPRALTNRKIITGIKTELTSALMGILGRGEVNGKAISDSGEQQDTVMEPETVAFVAKEDRAPAVELNVTSSRIEQDSMEKPQADEDVILKVKKDRKQKKKREASEDQSPNKEKKPKWSKEQKEQRRKERESNNGTAAIEPFDYSTAKSVLDSKPFVPVKEDGKKKKKEKKGKESKADSASKRTDGDGIADRYASISVRRDRREQQGGKSMSFSH